MKSTVLVAVAMTALTLSACGEDTKTFSSGDDFSIASALAQLPKLEKSDSLEVRIGDLKAATKSKGLTRPAADTDPNSMMAWLGPLTGGPQSAESDVFVPLPDSVSRSGPTYAKVTEELGWSIRDVDAFAVASALPNSFLVETGDFSSKTFAESLPREDGIVSAGNGEDFQANLSERTDARQMGQPVRMANIKDLIATSPSTPLIKAWKNGLEESLADDDAFMSVATQLDKNDVMSAILFKGRFDGPISLTPAMMDQNGKLPSGFDCVGVGWSVDQGEASMVVVYHFADKAAADQNRSILEDVWRDGTSTVTKQPIADMVKVEDVRTEADNVVVSLGKADGAGPSLPYEMLLRRDLPFISGAS